MLPQPPNLVPLSSLTPCSQLRLPPSAPCLISVPPQGFRRLPSARLESPFPRPSHSWLTESFRSSQLAVHLQE